MNYIKCVECQKFLTIKEAEKGNKCEKHQKDN